MGEQNNESVDGRFSKVTFSWLCGSFAWLAVAGMLGILESIPGVFAIAGIDGLELNTGVLKLARSGAFNYGWAAMASVALLFYCIRPHAGRWEGIMKTLAWCWSACVAAGVVSIVAGYGTGMSTMPFESWVFLPMTAIIWAIHFIVWYDSGERTWRVRVPALISFLFIAVSLGLISINQSWSGVDELLLMAGVRSSLIGSSVTIALTGLWRSTLVRNDRMVIPVSLLLTLLPVLSSVSGIRDLQGMPISWKLMQCAQWASWGLAGALCILSFLGLYRLVLKKEFLLPTVRFWLGASLVMMLLWGCVEFGISGGKLFQTSTAGDWYIVELLLFCSLGLLLRAAWHLCLHGKVSWGDYSWGLGCLFLWITWAMHGYADSSSRELPAEFFRQALCEGVAFASVFALVAWVFLFMSAMVSLSTCLRGEVGELVDESAGDGKRYGSVIRGCIGILAVMLLSASLGRIGDNDRSGSVTFSRRSGTALEGSLIYAREGCGVCHTQMVRMSPGRTDLQREIDHSGIEGGALRETQPEDFSARMKEGAAHAGWVALGPDLSHLETRLKKRLSYEDKAGRTLLIARPDEWLFLHMYNPREAMLKTPWSSCPALPYFFEEKPIGRFGRSSDAIPVHTRDGYELIPTREAKALVSYLETLARGEISREDGSAISDEELKTRSWHVPGAVMPAPDLTKAEQVRKKREFERGKEIYLAKCSVCHGTDGKGDGANYPPLRDSEWIAEKDASILVDIIRNGLEGPIKVQGREWNSIMLPPGIGTAQDVLPLINYLRGSMSSTSLPPVSKEEAERWWMKSRKEK